MSGGTANENWHSTTKYNRKYNLTEKIKTKRLTEIVQVARIFTVLQNLNLLNYFFFLVRNSASKTLVWVLKLHNKFETDLKYSVILYYYHRVSTQLQLTNISYKLGSKGTHQRLIIQRLMVNIFSAACNVRGTRVFCPQCVLVIRISVGTLAKMSWESRGLGLHTCHFWAAFFYPVRTVASKLKKIGRNVYLANHIHLT